MTSSSNFDEAFDETPSFFGNHFPIFGRSSETQGSMRVLERLALTLGVPVAAFFAEDARPVPSDEVAAEDIEDLTRAFLAITDPAMRRYCLDVVRAAGAEERSDEPA